MYRTCILYSRFEVDDASFFEATEVIWDPYFFPSKWRSVHRKHHTWANKETRSGSLRMIKSIQKDSDHKMWSNKWKQQTIIQTKQHFIYDVICCCFFDFNTRTVSKCRVCHRAPATRFPVDSALGWKRLKSWVAFWTCTSAARAGFVHEVMLISFAVV